LFGHPRVAKGHRADENQVSKTSVSCLNLNCLFLFFFLASFAASFSFSATKIFPFSSYQAGI